MEVAGCIIDAGQDARTGILAESDHGQWQRIGSENCRDCERGAAGGAHSESSAEFFGWRRRARSARTSAFDPPRRFGHGLHLGPVFRGGKPTDAGTPLVAGEIAGLIFVTQTPDYLFPATSHVLHHRLGCLRPATPSM